MNRLLILSIIIIGLFTAITALAWTNPSSNPPLGGGALNFYNGNVGIGTTNPGGKLAIVQDWTTGSPAMDIIGSSGDLTNYHLKLIPVTGGTNSVDYKLQTLDYTGGTKDMLYFDAGTGKDRKS